MVEFTVRPLFIKQSSERLGKFFLNDFQSSIKKEIKNNNDILLNAPTGSGKTMSLLLSDGFPSEDFPGFVAIYPNRTLLENQFKTVSDIIEKALNGVACKSSDPLRIYTIPKGTEGFPYDKVIMLKLSSTHIAYQGIPKRETLYKIAEKVYQIGGKKYVIIFSTPDTYLMIYTGLYRSFEVNGSAAHDIILLKMLDLDAEKEEEILRKKRIFARKELSPLISTSLRLLSHPLFIDEFHLYTQYEIDALYAILSLYKSEASMPVILSSATPAKDTIKRLKLNPYTIAPKAASSGFKVRGRTKVYLIPVESTGKGISSYFKAGEMMLGKIKSDQKFLNEILQHSKNDEKSLIIFDRLWMVVDLANFLNAKGIRANCIASVTPGYCDGSSSIIIGSESTTQGVNLGKVKLGITSGVSYEDVIQRVGRVGREGMDSKIYLFAPEPYVDSLSYKSEYSYQDFVNDVILNVYSGLTKRSMGASSLLPSSFHEIRSKIIASVAFASRARVSGNLSLLKNINIGKDDARRMLSSLICDSKTLGRMLLFRKNGFSINYRKINDNEGPLQENIGIITRNFKIAGVSNRGNALLVNINKKARSKIIIHVQGDTSILKEKFIDIRDLLDILGGYIELVDVADQSSTELNAGNSLVYISDLSEEIIEYLSYSGEGGIIESNMKKYAAIFV